MYVDKLKQEKIMVTSGLKVAKIKFMYILYYLAFDFEQRAVVFHALGFAGCTTGETSGESTQY